jgi:hypothetical protein
MKAWEGLMAIRNREQKPWFMFAAQSSEWPEAKNRTAVQNPRMNQYF